MNIVLFCATQRGRVFLERLLELAPEHHITVYSFREEAHEPPFLDDIREIAERGGAAFHQARNVRQLDIDPDLILAVNWRYIIPADVYTRARVGAYVFHDSLLPKYRGFSPTVWAMVNGEPYTGVTLFEMGEGFDTGAIVAQKRVGIGEQDTIADVVQNVTDAYLTVLDCILPELLSGNVTSTPQDHTAATYCCKRLPEDNRIDWTQTTAQIYNLIRAVTNPYPGAYTYLNERKLTVWSARRAEGRAYVGGVPGRVVEIIPGAGAVVLTGDGAILLDCVQVDGGEIVSADVVLNKLSFTLGSGRNAA